MNRRANDTVLGRAKQEAQRWAQVVLIVLVVVLGWYVSHLNRSVDNINRAVTRIEQSSSRTEVAADELVRFVHEIQAQQPSTSSGGQSAVVQEIVGLLCASSDPVRQKACADLTGPGG